MRILALDLETYSGVDLKSCGVYAYTGAPDFEILLVAYAFDDAPVRVIDLARGEEFPDELQSALTSEGVTKTAFNANFERTCLARHLNAPMPPEQWRCSQAHALTLGLPASLEGVARCLKLSQQKMQEGKQLIRYFSMPCKPTKANGGRIRNLPEHDLEKWELFKTYCKQDVEVERAIRKKLDRYPMPEQELKLWYLDQHINDYGVRLDLGLVENAVQCDEVYQKKLMKEAKALTGLENPNSPAQLKNWLQDKHDIRVESLSKAAVDELLETADEAEVKRALKLRQEMSRTSVKKYEAMNRAACEDDRVRGLLQYYGASTGRFSGRLVQIHNLPRNNMTDLALARKLLKAGDYEALELLFDSVPGVLSQLIRTAITPSPGHRFIVSDFSSIEARVIAWLAGERWVIDAFKEHGKIYEMTASKMFGVPLKHIVRGRPEYAYRQKGKVATLACIAEGQPVLTDTGLVPIEQITLKHKVWDGLHFVEHDGVIFRGEREVITYEGLTATKDHLVWIEGKPEPVRFEYAATSGAHLLLTGDGRKAIRVGKDYRLRKTVGQKLEPLLDANSMCGMLSDSVDKFKQPAKGHIKGVPEMLAAPANTNVVGQTANRCQTEMRKPKGCQLQKLRCQGHYVQIPVCIGGRSLDNEELRPARQGARNRPDRQRWPLRTGKHSLCNKEEELRQQENNPSSGMEPDYVALRQNRGGKEISAGDEKGRNHKGGQVSSTGETKKLADYRCKARLYDILNAGPYNRFTVSNCLVHNCGYQGSVGALKAMGAPKMGLQESELPEIVAAWRKANPKIVKLWWDLEAAAIRAVKDKNVQKLQRNVRLFYKAGVLFMQLPSGRSLAYVRPRIEPDERFNKYGLTYEGVELGKWCRIRTYGGKLTENIVQAIARDCLAESLLRLDKAGYKIAFHVHDEVVLDVPRGTGSLEEVAQIMGWDIDWAPGLPMRAEGFETDYYKKD